MKGLARCGAVIGLGLVLALLVRIPAPAQEKEEDGLTVVHFPAPEFPTLEMGAREVEQPSPGEGEPGAGAVRGTRGERPNAEEEVTTGANVAWINSPPLTIARLRGNVLLIDFWEYTCINCIRTFPENKKWYERYHKYGFTIIGVHDPEFDIAYSPAHVREAVKRFGLPYPVVVDSNFLIWRAYKNNTWPNRFLVDASGVVRYNRSGEGADGAFERAIQRLLKEAHPGLEFPASDSIPPDVDRFAASCGIPTPEMYVGNWSGRGILANPEGYQDGKNRTYRLPASIEEGRAALSGTWKTDKNGMIYHGKAKSDAPSSDQLEMRYHAREVYVVMNVSHGRPSKLFVEQDGKPLTSSNKGADVQFGSEGRSFIEVREPRMYYLVQNAAFGSHNLGLFPTRSGLTINSFTFGNDCQTDFPHL